MPSQAASSGVRIGQWDLSPWDMKAIPVLCPPDEEQVVIASFLDEFVVKIERLIAANQRFGPALH